MDSAQSCEEKRSDYYFRLVLTLPSIEAIWVTDEQGGQRTSFLLDQCKPAGASDRHVHAREKHLRVRRYDKENEFKAEDEACMNGPLAGVSQAIYPFWRGEVRGEEVTMRSACILASRQ